EGKSLPLVGLVREEGSAEDETGDDPVAGRLELPALLRPHSELESRAGGQKSEREDQRLDRVEVGSRRKRPRRRPQRHVVGADREEGGEQAAEEHEFRAEPDDYANGEQLGPPRLLSAVRARQCHCVAHGVLLSPKTRPNPAPWRG